MHQPESESNHLKPKRDLLAGYWIELRLRKQAGSKQALKAKAVRTTAKDLSCPPVAVVAEMKATSN